ncbi:RING finger protein 44-like isoform X2 [Tenebrio molitor]|uniref:RING finger protein 44-like isoform X2 n=1 Tax=Tenebrio molitor TaxID=7067 RepID=UPI003624A97E
MASPFDFGYLFYCNNCDDYFSNDSQVAECPFCFSVNNAILDNTESSLEESGQTNQTQQERRHEELSNRLDFLESVVEQILISSINNVRLDDRPNRQMHHQVNSDGLTASLESSVDIVHTTSPTPSASAPSPLPQRPPRRPAPRRPAPQPPMQPLGLGFTVSSPHGSTLPPPSPNPLPNRENSRSTTFFCHVCEEVFQNVSRSSYCPQCANDFIEELVNVPVVGNTHSSPSVRTETPGASVPNPAIISTLYPHRYVIQQRRTIIRPRQTPSSSASSSSHNTIVTTIQINSEQRNANPLCPICWENFTVEERVAKLPCNHIYHQPCIATWLQANNNCPICRRDVSDNLHFFKYE